MHAVVSVRGEVFFVSYFLDQASERWTGNFLDIQFLELAGRRLRLGQLRLLYFDQFNLPPIIELIFR